MDAAAVALYLFLGILGAFLVLLSCVFLSYSLYLVYIHRTYAHLPTPKPFSFFLGHFGTVSKIGKEQLVFDSLYFDWYEQCGPLFIIYVLHIHFVVLLDPKDVKEVFMNRKVYKPPRVYDVLARIFSERFLGRSLLTESNYDQWKKRRSLYDPMFNKFYLRTLGAAFNQCVDRFIKKLTPLADGKTVVSMKNEFSLVTLDVISTVAFGSDFRTWSSGIPELMNISSEGELVYLLRHALTGVETEFYYIGFRYLHPFKTRSYRRAVRAIRTIGRNCIQKRIAAIEKGEEVPTDILTQTLRIAKSDDGVTIEDLLDDFATFYVAGQETTSNLLSFAFVQISQHPSIYQQMMEEIEEVVGEKEYVSPEDAEKLQYTMQVLEETLRLYPPVAGVTRALGEAMVLGGYELPKGTNVNMSTFAACRLLENFDEPEKFDPSRFKPDRLRPDPFVYFPFTRGHRSCIGSVFAMLEVRIILARLLKKFRFTFPADYQLEMTSCLTVQPRGPVECTVRPVHL